MMLTTWSIITGCVIGVTAGAAGYFFLKKPRSGGVSSETSNDPPKSDHRTIRLLAWDEFAIEKIAIYAKKHGFEAVAVRKGAALKGFAEKLPKNIGIPAILTIGTSLNNITSGQMIADVATLLADLSERGGGVIVPVAQNGEEDWSKGATVEIDSDKDALPDFFLVNSEGRYTQVEV